MQILPLGGAGEVGASCTLLEIAGAHILIDAGIRVGSGTGVRPQLPAFELLEHVPDAVVVTHAHTDHTGALPVLGERIGDAQIHMTVATLHLIQVLQGDALRQKGSDDAEADSGDLSYTAEDVERMLARTRAHSYYRPFHPVPGRPDITFEYVPCGHILGAGSLIIDSPEARGVHLGDFSLSPQSTIRGLDLEYLKRKSDERPFDFVISEATYGAGRPHPDRRKESARFIRLLERCTARGGKVLIPSFALGRAQDIVCDIRQAKLAGKLKDVPVILDGMVQPATAIYENITHEMFPGREPLQLLDPDLGIVKANAQSRARLQRGEQEGPAIIVSSSGMLIGGQSVRYARALVDDRKNAILISGYQDAMSPGHRLLNLRKGERLRLGEERVRVRCQVARYHTSAHADCEQLQLAIESLGAKKNLLVHGDPEALEAMRARLGKRKAVVLENGVPFRMGRRRSWDRARRAARDAIESASSRQAPVIGPTPSEVEVRGVWEDLIQEGERDYSETEVAARFLGHAYSPEAREMLAATLADHRLYLVPGSRLGQRSYRPRPKGELIEMMIERAAAFQVPLEVGEVVVFSDGAPDLFVALVTRVDGAEVEALIPFSSRTRFRRDWLRVRTGIRVGSAYRPQTDRHLSGWLTGLVREARNQPPLNAVDLYFAAQAYPDGFDCDSALGMWHPEKPDGPFTSSLRLAAGLTLGGARALFSLGSDGLMRARPEDEASSRWRLMPRILHLRSLEPGTSVQLSNGQAVVPTGVLFSDSFEAQTSDGAFTRTSFRRVLLPEEAAAAAVLAEQQAESSNGRRGRRRARGADAKSGTGRSEEPPVAGRGRKRRRRRGRRRQAVDTA